MVHGSEHPAPGASRVPEGTNGYAVAAALLGFLGACPLGIGLGVVALVQTARSRQRGRALAVLGIVLSALWIAGFVALGKNGAAPDGVARDDAGVVEGRGRIAVDRLRVGDCITGFEDGVEIADIQVAPCSQPHRGQVFAIVILAGSDLAGDDEIGELASQRCQRAAAILPPRVLDDPHLVLSWFQPLEQDWSAGDRRTACLMEAPTPWTGSVLSEHA